MPLADSGINDRLVKLRPLRFDENTDEKLSAVDYFQCKIFEHRKYLNHKIIKSFGALCRIDDAHVSNLITALCSNLNICI